VRLAISWIESPSTSFIRPISAQRRTSSTTVLLASHTIWRGSASRRTKPPPGRWVRFHRPSRVSIQAAPTCEDCAQPRMAGLGAVSDDPARGGMRIGAAVRPLGSRAPGTGPIVTSLARLAIRSPHLSPIVMSGSGRLRGFCVTRPGSIEAPCHLQQCRASLLRAEGHWDFVWDFAHFRGA
jgi:hypothetical protein